MAGSGFLKTQYPIIQAPMAGVQDEALALAVMHAGGLGSLPCAMLDADEILHQGRLLQAEAGVPFNLNFFCHQAPVWDAADNDRWLQALSPYLQQFGIDAANVGQGAARQPFDTAKADAVATLAPAFVSFHFGLPPAPLLTQVKASGATVLSSATTVEEARWLVEHGADAVIAQGVEAGGHRGMFLTTDLSTQQPVFELLPKVIAAVDVPVIAAGGIATPAAVSRALGMGAAAVQVGTAFLLCHESRTSELHRRALQSERAQDSVLTNVFSGRPARAIRNRAVNELGPISPAAPAFPLAGNAIALLRKAAEAQGLDDLSSLWGGQNAAACRSESAAEITRWLAGV